MIDLKGSVELKSGPLLSRAKGSMPRSTTPPIANMKGSQDAFDTSLRQLLIDMDNIDEDGSRSLDFDEFSTLVRNREVYAVLIILLVLTCLTSRTSAHRLEYTQTRGSASALPPWTSMGMGRLALQSSLPTPCAIHSSEMQRKMTPCSPPLPPPP